MQQIEYTPSISKKKYSPLAILKRLGDKIAGHKNLKKIEALIKLSAISSRSRICNRSLNVAKHSRSCVGNCLFKEQKKKTIINKNKNILNISHPLTYVILEL